MAEKPPTLDERATRRFTDRECANILGGLIGGLCQYAEDVDAVRRAVTWWANESRVWEAFIAATEAMAMTTRTPTREATEEEYAAARDFLNRDDERGQR